MGVVIRRWVWLECIGVVVGVVRRYIDVLILLILTPLVLALFLQQHPFQIVKKSRSRGHGDIIISIRMHVTTSPETSTCEAPSDV